MSILDLITGDTIAALVLGILGGQKLRITLGNKKLPVKGQSRKASGRSAVRTRASDLDPARSRSDPGPELPYMVDPGS